MLLHVDVRHGVVPAEARRYAETKLGRIGESGLVDRAHVILEEDHGKFRAEMVLTLRNGHTVFAEAIEKEFRTAFDRLYDKADRQVRKFRDRTRERRPADRS